MKNNKKNIYLIIAGIINSITALLHTIGGQLDLVNPLSNSNLSNQQKAEWIGGWHIITIVLYATSYLLLKTGFNSSKQRNSEIVKYIGIIYLLFSIPFIITSVTYNLLAPQWILLFPIALYHLFTVSYDCRMNFYHCFV